MMESESTGCVRVEAPVRHLTLGKDFDWKCECGETHQIEGWVAAHWREKLVHTCQACGRKHTLNNGILRLVIA